MVGQGGVPCDTQSDFGSRIGIGHRKCDQRDRVRGERGKTRGSGGRRSHTQGHVVHNRLQKKKGEKRRKKKKGKIKKGGIKTNKSEERKGKGREGNQKMKEESY